MISPLAAQQIKTYAIQFEAGEDALPSLADLDSIKALATFAMVPDTQKVVIRRYIDYWVQNDAYYTLIRKRSLLLQQIFDRAGFPPDSLLIETRALQAPQQADSLSSHLMEVLVSRQYQSPLAKNDLAEEETNYFSEIRQLMWALIKDQQQRFNINPWRDTLLWSAQGMAIYIPAGSFQLPTTVERVTLGLREAFQKSSLLPYQMSTLDQQEQLRNWGVVLHLSASARGRAAGLKPGRGLFFAAPAGQLLTRLQLYQSLRGPKTGLNWKKVYRPKTGESINPACLHLAESRGADFRYFCDRLKLQRPPVPAFPEKPKRPQFFTADSSKLERLDSIQQIYLNIEKKIKSGYQEKQDKFYLFKKKKEKNERKYQRELETVMHKVKRIDKTQKELLQAVEAKNDSLRNRFQLKFNAYNQLRDSLQQAYLHALRDWHTARDSLQWLCLYEQHQVLRLKQRYDSLFLEQLRRQLNQRPYPDLQSPKAKTLFPTGKMHYFFESPTLGWLSLQQKVPLQQLPLNYKIFTYDNLPTYKVNTAAVLRSQMAQVPGKAKDKVNLSFNPLPAETPLWVLAIYLEEGRPFMALQEAVANKLPLQLEFKGYQSAKELAKALQKLNE